MKSTVMHPLTKLALNIPRKFVQNVEFGSPKEPSEVGLFSFPVDYTSFCMEGMFKEPLFKDPWRKDTAMW